jgi:pSer/pThr/pTyr-binding forkhead associated (FHA) protein
VEAQVMLEKISYTTTRPAPPKQNPNDTPPAFFIVNGTEVFPLDRPVLNIGRRPDNQLVIDDPRVSRVHAQLRAIRGRYVIFDLDSTGGTFVNNQPVRQSVLYTGDVVSLAGVPLVFGQEGADSSQTQPLPAD